MKPEIFEKVVKNLDDDDLLILAKVLSKECKERAAKANLMKQGKLS